MSMLELFSPPARCSLVRAGGLVRHADRPLLGTDVLLLALTDHSPVGPVLARLGASRSAVRDVLVRRWGWDGSPDDRQLLASLGINLDGVRDALPEGSEAAVWRLTRSRLRPPRVQLSGPTGSYLLSGRARKVLEVALWRGRRHGEGPTDVDLLHGLLADGDSRSVQALGALRVCFASLVDHLDAHDLAA